MTSVEGSSFKKIWPYRCKECNKSFRSKDAMVYHEFFHSSVPNFKYSCFVCNVGFNSKIKLFSHQNSVHKVWIKTPKARKKLGFCCSRCKDLAKQKNLKPLLKPGSSKCFYCGIDEKAKLKSVNCDKRRNRTIQCGSCEELFDTTYALSKHKMDCKDGKKDIVTAPSGDTCPTSKESVSAPSGDTFATSKVQNGELIVKLERLLPVEQAMPLGWVNGNGVTEYSDWKDSSESSCSNEETQDSTKEFRDVNGQRPLQFFSCKICEKSFEEVVAFDAHSCENLKQKSSPVNSRYSSTCNGCGKRFTQLFRLSEHQQIMFSCPKCHKSFPCSKSKKEHLLICKPEGYLIKNRASRSKKTASSELIESVNSDKHGYGKSSLRRSPENAEYSRYGSTCNGCGKRFTQLFRLSEHQENVFTCPKCNKSFPCTKSKKDHLMVCKPEGYSIKNDSSDRSKKNNASEIISENSASTNVQKNDAHVISNVKKPFSSDKTKVPVSNNTSVIAVANVHNSDSVKEANISSVTDNSQDSLTCGSCGKKFSHLSRLLVHQRPHQKHQCDLCSQLFLCWQLLQDHRKSCSSQSKHGGKKLKRDAVECLKCGKQGTCACRSVREGDFSESVGKKTSDSNAARRDSSVRRSGRHKRDSSECSKCGKECKCPNPPNINVSRENAKRTESFNKNTNTSDSDKATRDSFARHNRKRKRESDNCFKCGEQCNCPQTPIDSNYYLDTSKKGPKVNGDAELCDKFVRRSKRQKRDSDECFKCGEQCKCSRTPGSLSDFHGTLKRVEKVATDMENCDKFVRHSRRRKRDSDECFKCGKQCNCSQAPGRFSDLCGAVTTTERVDGGMKSCDKLVRRGRRKRGSDECFKCGEQCNRPQTISDFYEAINGDMENCDKFAHRSRRRKLASEGCFKCGEQCNCPQKLNGSSNFQGAVTRIEKVDSEMENCDKIVRRGRRRKRETDKCFKCGEQCNCSQTSGGLRDFHRAVTRTGKVGSEVKNCDNFIRRSKRRKRYSDDCLKCGKQCSCSQKALNESDFSESAERFKRINSNTSTNESDIGACDTFVRRSGRRKGDSNECFNCGKQCNCLRRSNGISYSPESIKRKEKNYKNPRTNDGFTATSGTNQQQNPADCFKCGKQCNCLQRSSLESAKEGDKNPSANDCDATACDIDMVSQNGAADSSDDDMPSCDGCGKTFRDQMQLVDHHRSKGKFGIRCEMCALWFPCAAGLRIHAKTKHSSYTCTDCGSILANAAARDLHVCGREVDKNICQLCQEVLPSASALYNHSARHAARSGFIIF